MTNFEDFTNLLSLLNSPDNDTRNNAETALDQMDDKLKLALLLQGMASPQLPLENRNLSAVLARRQIRNSFEKSFKEVSPTDQAIVKAQLLDVMSREAVREIRLKMAEVVSSLAEKQLEESEEVEPSGDHLLWPELVQFVLQSSVSESSSLRECALRILTNVPSLFAAQEATSQAHIDANKANLQALGTLLMRGFADGDIAVRLGACKAFHSVTDCFEDEPEAIQALKGLVPHVLQAVADSLKADADDTTGLTVLTELCDDSPKMLRPYLIPTLDLCFSVTSNDQLDDSQRHLSLECMISLTERIPAAIRKAGHKYIDPLCQTMLRMMTDLEEQEGWAQADEQEEDDEQSNAFTGETSLDRFACAIGGKQVLDVIVRLVPQMLRGSDWRERHAGLMAISACGEGCHKAMQHVLASIIDTVVPMLADPHPRVRFAACNALGQLSTDFSPKLQKHFHAKVLPALMRVLDDMANPRVQSHASAALVNFCESCPKSILLAYLDQLVGKLEQVMTARYQDLVTQGKKMVLEQVVTTVAALADAVEEGFTLHYGRFVPGLKYIIQNAVQPELRLLRGKTIECISLIALAVGKERFMPDSREIIELLLKAQTESENFSSDDPQLTYMISAWARICRLLGPDFQPFLPSVMGPLMKVAASEPECSIYDEDDADSGEVNAEWTTLKLNDNQNFAINTSGIEDKATACNLLVCYAKEIKAGFLPYCQEVTALMIKLSKFYFNDEIRTASAEIFPHLLEVALANGETYQRQLWAEIAPTLLRVLDCEPEREVLGDFLLSMANCIKIVGPNALSVEQLNQLGHVMQVIFKAHFDKHDERVAQRQGEDYDEEEETRLLSEKDEDEYVLSKLSDLMRSLFTTHGAEMLPFFQQLLPQITKLLEPSRPWSDFQWGLCFFVDLLEYVGSEHIEMYREDIQQLLAKGCVHPEADLRQTACYGVGIAAKMGGASYGPWLAQMVPLLVHIIEDALKNAAGGSASVVNVPEELACSMENAISSLGKIMDLRPEVLAGAGLTVDSLLTRWLTWLPLRYDEEEVPHVYGFVCKLLEQNHPQLMANAMETIPHIVHCFTVSITSDVLKPEQPVFHRCMALVRHVQTNPEMLNRCLEKLNADERVALEKALHVPPPAGNAAV